MNISLIIPCFNEEANIQKGVLDKIGNFTASDNRFEEILIVDDGSSDESVHIIEEKYLYFFPKFRLVKNRHQGKAAAILKGIKESKGDYVFFSDMDLATPIEECEKLIAQIEHGYHIVIGSRKGSRDGAPLTRKIMATGMIVVRSLVIGLNGIHDTQCGFKLFQKTAAEEISKRLKVFGQKTQVNGSSVSAGFDLEFLFLARRLGYKIKEIPVTWRHVETKRVTFVKSSWEAIRDIALIKWHDILQSYPRH